MINNILIKSQFDNLELSVNYLIPDENIKGIVFIVHGMSEHKERYNYFLDKIKNNSYIAVVYDGRGHGKSIKDKNDLGYFYTNDCTALREDLYTVMNYFQDKYKLERNIIFAHSMGTLVVRSFLQKYDDIPSKVILCGPPIEQRLVDVGLFIAKISNIFQDSKKVNNFLNKLTFSSFNKGYKIENEWLSKNKENVLMYNKDNLCGFTFTNNGFLILYKLQKLAFQKNKYLVKNANLPIFLIAGSKDPVIGSIEKFKKLELFLKQVGYKNIDTKLYKDLRHELLQEKEKDLIIDDIINFINS